MLAKWLILLKNRFHWWKIYSCVGISIVRYRSSKTIYQACELLIVDRSIDQIAGKINSIIREQGLRENWRLGAELINFLRTKHVKIPLYILKSSKATKAQSSCSWRAYRQSI